MIQLIFDIETNIGKNKNQALFIQNNQILCLAAHDRIKQQDYMFTDYEIQKSSGKLQDGINLLSQADQLVGHNIIDFDLQVLMFHYNFKPKDKCKIRDTLIMSRILYPELFAKGKGHSLKYWGDKLGFPKGSNPCQMGEEMAKYCLNDVMVNLQLYKRLINRIQTRTKPQKYKDIIDMECTFAMAVAQQARTGFPFDTQAAKDLLENKKKELATLLDNLKGKMNES